VLVIWRALFDPRDPMCSRAQAIVRDPTLAPAGWTPRILFSRHLEHFAAFYVATVMAVAALPRARLMRIGFGMALFAVTLEVLRAAPSLHVGWTIAPAEADLGGVLAALAPIVAEKFRSLFDPREFS